MDEFQDEIRGRMQHADDLLEKAEAEKLKELTEQNKQAKKVWKFQPEKVRGYQRNNLDKTLQRWDRAEIAKGRKPTYVSVGARSSSRFAKNALATGSVMLGPALGAGAAVLGEILFEDPNNAEIVDLKMKTCCNNKRLKQVARKFLDYIC